jgi:hypothetical protein
VVWLKEANANPTGGFPASTDSLLWNLGNVVQVLKQKLPNVRLCYLTSRIYAGYASSTLNPEPYAYESGFAVKWLIDAQIQGADSLNFDPGAGPVKAPWMAWGPYLWADGTTPRSDGLTWVCSEFVSSDGTHPSTTGRDVVSDSLLVFFARDETTVPWFLAPHSTAIDERAAVVAFTVAPSPAIHWLDLRFTAAAGVEWRADVLDVGGRRVRMVDRGMGNGQPIGLRWDLRDQAAARVAPGLYWVRLRAGDRMVTRRCVVID